MKLHNLKLYLMFPLSIPSILIYLSMKDKECINADMESIGYEPGVWGLHRVLVDSFSFRSVFRMRVRDESEIKYAFLFFSYRPLSSLELNCMQKVGKGLAIWHGYSSVIFCNSIGDHCSIYQNVTIGRGRYMGNGTQIPDIGNNVAIYAGAIVVGGITIGDYCEIGAGTVVTKDVPPHSTVIGNPMRILPGKL